MPRATRDDTLASYEAALAAALYVDRDVRHRLLDNESGAAWRAYGAVMPAAIRADFVVKNPAVSCPAAFAPAVRWTFLEQLPTVIALWQDQWTEHGASLLPRALRESADVSRQRADAAARAKLLPLLQTMVDLLPWVRQWHSQDGETVDRFEKYVGEECRNVELGVAEVRAWRAPVGAKRGRGRVAKASPRSAASAVGEEAVLAAVKQALVDGTATVEVGVVAGVLGVAGAKLKGPVDSLVGSGALVEVKKRPRTVRLNHCDETPSAID